MKKLILSSLLISVFASATVQVPKSFLIGETFSGSIGGKLIAAHFLKEGDCLARKENKLPNIETCSWKWESKTSTLSLTIENESSEWKMKSKTLLENAENKKIELRSIFLSESLKTQSGFDKVEISQSFSCKKEFPNCSEIPSLMKGTCTATDRFETYSSRLSKNLCLASKEIWTQICSSDLDPEQFTISCHQLRGVVDEQTPPPSGAQISQVAFLPDCSKDLYACNASAHTNDLGCVATNGQVQFSSMEGFNNGCDSLRLRDKICKAGLKPADFRSACYEKMSKD